MSDAGQVPRIHRLSAALANQIAAGEVIERPASVVKELLENSLDAAASEIEIIIEKAGNRLIRVRDNGQGIHADDLVLALDRHATSKLHTCSDLEQIVSLGFRGEALPSIASVSRLSITSRSIGAENAWTVVCDGPDQASPPVPAAHPTGTSVDVQDLFFNTPGRRKFLKSGKTEFLHIQSLIRRLALSRHGVGFRCQHNGYPVCHYIAAANSPEQRFIDVCGKAFFRQALSLDYEREGMHLWGWTGVADSARSQSDRQFFFLNGRIVHDKHVNHAVRMAYQDLIYADRYPVYVLYLEMDPAAVDVNVHPTKHEVRFREPRNVHDFIYSGMHKVLTTTAHGGSGLPGDRIPTNQARDYRQAGTTGPQAGCNLGETVLSYANPSALRQRGRSVTRDTLPVSGRGFVLCQGRFLIMEMNNDPVLINIHAAREAVTSARLHSAHTGGGIRTRPLLVPLTLQIPEADAGFVVENTAVFGQFGFCIDRVAPESLLLRELPALLPYADAVPLLRDVVNTLRDVKNEIDPQVLIKVMASHANDGAAQTLDSGQIDQLWDDIRWLEQESGGPQRHQLYCILDRARLIRLIQGP